MSKEDAIKVVDAIDDACMFSDVDVGEKIIKRLETVFPELPWREIWERDR